MRPTFWVKQKWLMVAMVLAAACVRVASLLGPPVYEASAQLWVDQEQGDQSTNFSGSGEEVQTLPPKGGGLQPIILTMTHAIHSRPVAERAIRRLGLRMKPAELLDNLTVEQFESTSFIALTYEGTDPQKAQQIVNTVGKVSSELISGRMAGGSRLTATLYEPAVVPESPVSSDPVRDGLLRLVMWLVLSAVFALALPGVAESVAGKLGGQALRQGIGQAGLPGVPPADPSEAERIKEQELLEALHRRGRLTAVEAALETSLSVREANRMLFELALRGHLEVTVEHGKLLYAFWEHGA